MTTKTDQQEAPEALRLANYLEEMANELVFTHFTMDMDAAAVELRRLHAENVRLATLVDAQQPAPSAAAHKACKPNPLRAALLKCIAAIERTAHCNEADRLAAADEARQALAAQAADSALEDAAPQAMLSQDVRVTVNTLMWWRDLASINPQDLIPRIDAAIGAARKQGANHD